jgi:serine protease AprX
MVRSGVASLLLLLSFNSLLAQENRYIVFFTDKNNSEYSINNPSAFLSPKSIARRAKNGISINDSDLPVINQYVLDVENLGAAAFHRTKWMNAVLVEMLPDLIPIIEALPFVNAVLLVSEGTQLLDQELNRDPPLPPLINAPRNEEVTFFQNDMVGIPYMHEQNLKGEGMIIGVFDAGFPNLSRIDAFSHLFENDQLMMTKDYTSNQVYVEDLAEHGLQVLSILAANRNDFKGIAPNADYLLFITEDTRLGTETPIEEYNWLFAAEAADSAGVDLISSSLGYNVFDAPFTDYTYEDMNGENTVISRAAGLAFDKGILVVTSAGNSGNNSWKYITAPADQPKVISVGSVNANLDKSGFSSFGPNSNGQIKPDVMAFGSSTATINREGNVELVSGTSVSGPIVSGLVIGLLQAMPTESHLEIANAIRASGDNSLNINNSYGYGIPNFKRALTILNQPTPVVEDNILVYPNPIMDNHVFIKFDDVNYGLNNEIRLISIDGKGLIKMEVSPNEIRNQIELNMAQYPSGIYLLIMVNSNGKFTRKLIKY